MTIAFCFLSYADLDHVEYWNTFFDGADPALYRCVIHQKTMGSTKLRGATLLPSIPTQWGTFSIVEAQQKLFEAACMDPAVIKCILLSGDSIPLYDFNTIYTRLLTDDKSYMEHTFPTARGHIVMGKRPLKQFWPADKSWNWAKASQWVVLHRRHVQLLTEQWAMIKQVFNVDKVIADEHVYTVFFSGFGCIAEFHTKSLVWAQWSDRTIKCSIVHRLLPKTYHSADFTPRALSNIYNSGALFMRKLCATANLTLVRPKPAAL